MDIKQVLLPEAIDTDELLYYRKDEELVETGKMAVWSSTREGRLTSIRSLTVFPLENGENIQSLRPFP